MERLPIKHWECEGEHLYRDFPQKEGKMMNVQHIKEATIVEHVDRKIARIHATMEN
jgi:hypothetical protein